MFVVGREQRNAFDGEIEKHADFFIMSKLVFVYSFTVS